MAEKRQETVTSNPCILPAVRVGDIAREQAAARLSAYLADGCLTQEEFDARRDIILTAKTLTQIHQMFADLPKGGTRWQLTPQELPAKKKRPGPDPLMPLLGVLFLSAGLAIGGDSARVTWLFALGLTLMLTCGGAAVIYVCREMFR